MRIDDVCSASYTWMNHFILVQEPDELVHTGVDRCNVGPADEFRVLRRLVGGGQAGHQLGHINGTRIGAQRSDARSQESEIGHRTVFQPG